MGLKLNGIMFDSRNVDIGQLINELKDLIKEYEYNKVGKQFGEDLIRSFFGSKLIEIGYEEKKHHFRMFFVNTFEEVGNNIVPNEYICKQISSKIKDTPFVNVIYHSGVDTGNIIVAQNGNILNVINGEEGDELECAKDVLSELFDINDVYKTLKEYVSAYTMKSPYSYNSYPYLRHSYEEWKDSDDTIGIYYTNQLKGVEAIINDPNITDEELSKITEYPRDFLKSYVNSFYDIKQGEDLCQAYILTEGNVWQENGAIYLSECKYLTPEDYFTEKGNIRKDREDYKDRTYGKRPKSYNLSEYELNILSYEEQKKKAYELYEIANKRGDETFGSTTKGIKIKAPAQKGSYITFKGDYLKVEDCFFKPDPNSKNFIEILRCSKRDNKNNYITTIFIEPEDFSLVKNINK